MSISLKRGILLVVLALALVVGLLGWSLKAMSAPLQHLHHANITHSHVVANVCPPPPFSCWP